MSLKQNLPFMMCMHPCHTIMRSHHTHHTTCVVLHCSAGLELSPLLYLQLSGWLAVALVTLLGWEVTGRLW